MNTICWMGLRARTGRSSGPETTTLLVTIIMMNRNCGKNSSLRTCLSFLRSPGLIASIKRRRTKITLCSYYGTTHIAEREEHQKQKDGTKHRQYKWTYGRSPYRLKNNSRTVGEKSSTDKTP